MADPKTDDGVRVDGEAGSSPSDGFWRNAVARQVPFTDGRRIARQARLDRPVRCPDAMAPGSREASELAQGWLCFALQPFTKKQMEYTVGQVLMWTPVHFKWDKARKVSVSKVYPRGYALLSNGFIVDADGMADWRSYVAGKVSEIAPAGAMHHSCQVYGGT